MINQPQSLLKTLFVLWQFWVDWWLSQLITYLQSYNQTCILLQIINKGEYLDMHMFIVKMCLLHVSTHGGILFGTDQIRHLISDTRYKSIPAVSYKAMFLLVFFYKSLLVLTSIWFPKLNNNSTIAHILCISKRHFLFNLNIYMLYLIYAIKCVLHQLILYIENEFLTTIW